MLALILFPLVWGAAALVLLGGLQIAWSGRF